MVIVSGLVISSCSHNKALTSVSNTRLRSPSTTVSTTVNTLSSSVVSTTQTSNLSSLCNQTVFKAETPQSAVAAGTIVTTFQFVNQGTQICDYSGYPKIEFLSAQNTVIPVKISTGLVPGVASNPGIVSVGPGSSISFAISYSDVTSGNEPCQKTAKISVVLPNFSSPLIEPLSVIICSPQGVIVSPIV